MAASTATAQLLALMEDYHSFNPGEPPLLPYPSPLQFSKQVSRGLPCLYSLPPGANDPQIEPQDDSNGYPMLPANEITSWPTLFWTRSKLVEAVKQKVEVAVTPDGLADALCSSGPEGEKVFLQPATVQMSMQELLDKLSPSSPPYPVYYLQSQNSNLTTTPLASLMKDLPASIPFAEPVVGSPEAINLWIGNSSSITSTHRDPYENLYLVLKGTKIFTLWAPVDEITLSAEMVRTGHYTYDPSKSPSFSTSLDSDSGGTSIPWVPIDPHLPRSTLNASYPMYAYAQPKRVCVSEGQILYLPAGWYHHVSQDCGTWDDGSEAPCIAVNYWYDQDYEGEKYVTRQLIGRLVEQSQKEQTHKICLGEM